MSDDTMDPKVPTSAPEGQPFAPDPTHPDWQRWYRDLRVAFDDLDAVIRDQLRPPRKRDLGVREAKRLYRDARDKLKKLFASADRAGAKSGTSER